jgi:hypothetical protein
MGFDASSKPIESDQMGNLVHQGDQKSVFVERGVYGNQMLPRGQPSIITVSGHSMVHYFQVHLVFLNEVQTCGYGPLGKVFL